jgi:hypothetical protein
MIKNCQIENRNKKKENDQYSLKNIKSKFARRKKRYRKEDNKKNK